MKRRNDTPSKCSLKTCVNCEKGICDLSNYPAIFKNISPNKVGCPQFDDNPKETYQKVKQSGGIIGLILKKNNRRTDNEISEIKKAKRKQRSDKGTKRGARKK